MASTNLLSATTELDTRPWMLSRGYAILTAHTYSVWNNRLMPAGRHASISLVLTFSELFEGCMGVLRKVNRPVKSDKVSGMCRCL